MPMHVRHARSDQDQANVPGPWGVNPDSTPTITSSGAIEPTALGEVALDAVLANSSVLNFGSLIGAVGAPGSGLCVSPQTHGGAAAQARFC
jgi:hypothetical protein